MGKRKRARSRLGSDLGLLDLNETPRKAAPPPEPAETPERGLFAWLADRKIILGGSALALLLLTLGVFASNGWLPRTEASGRKVGWFGRVLSEPGAVATGLNPWNPFAAPSATPTPQLSKSYVYAGSRLLASEDKNATAVPPADLGIWRPKTGEWWILSGGQIIFEYGQNGDQPVQGDFDGDGKTDFSVFRPSNGIWYIRYSSDDSDHWYSFPSGTYIPVPADYNGDGRTDAALWDSNSPYAWHIQLSGSNAYTQYFGTEDDIPVPADYDGDGVADLAVRRPGTTQFYIKKSSDGTIYNLSYGLSADVPKCADYDGDGRADIALFRPSDATWYILNSATNQTTAVQYGLEEDELVPNDYDNDGKVDIAVFRCSKTCVWYIRQSSDLTTRVESWGLAEDIPVPALYRR